MLWYKIIQALCWLFKKNLIPIANATCQHCVNAAGCDNSRNKNFIYTWIWTQWKHLNAIEVVLELWIDGINLIIFQESTVNVAIVGEELSIDSLNLITCEWDHREVCQWTKEMLIDISNILVVNEQISQIDESNEGINVDNLQVVVTQYQGVHVDETAESISLNAGNSVALQNDRSQISCQNKCIWLNPLKTSIRYLQVL